MDMLFRAWIWKDACWKETTTISISDRGFRYGASVFETLFIKAGEPIFWNAHIAQFQEARCALADAAVEAFPQADRLKELVLHGVSGRDAMLRFVATEGEGGIMKKDGATHTLVAYMDILSASQSDKTPLHTVVFPEPFSPVLHGHKTGSYLFHVRARRYADAQGVDESVLVRENGEWISASMANLFLISKGEIRTPPLASGARKGVVRSWIEREVGLREEILFRDDFLSAEGVFITNSRIGIQEIGRIDGCDVSLSGKTGGLHRRWMEMLHRTSSVK